MYHDLSPSSPPILSKRGLTALHSTLTQHRLRIRSGSYTNLAPLGFAESISYQINHFRLMLWFPQLPFRQWVMRIYKQSNYFILALLGARWLHSVPLFPLQTPPQGLFSPLPLNTRTVSALALNLSSLSCKLSTCSLFAPAYPRDSGNSYTR